MLQQDLSDGDGVGVPLGEVAAVGFCFLFFALFDLGVASGFVPGSEGMRDMICSRTMGMDLLCSPWSCVFRAGGFAAGGEASVGFLGVFG